MLRPYRFRINRPTVQPSHRQNEYRSVNCT